MYNILFPSDTCLNILYTFPNKHKLHAATLKMGCGVKGGGTLNALLVWISVSLKTANKPQREMKSVLFKVHKTDVKSGRSAKFPTTGAMMKMHLCAAFRQKSVCAWSFLGLY